MARFGIAAISTHGRSYLARALTDLYYCSVPLHLVDHPLVHDALVDLRDARTAPPEFRRAANRISVLLAAEALRDVPSTPDIVQTPLGPADGVGPAVVDPETTAELDHALTEEAQAGLQRTVASLGRDAATRVLHGDPAAEICREAEDGGYDLVVIGSHGYGVVKRVLLGSVSHHVLHHAPCPVLVVRVR